MEESSQKPKIVIICGPTGVGKTRFAIDLARRSGGQIVGADSMQIYRRMDIGTAKPTAEERAAVYHHMVDIIDPDQSFDAAAYGDMAFDIVNGLVGDELVPFVVGGTGLYIKALLYGLFKTTDRNDNVRDRLKRQLAQEGSAAMHQRLASHDADAAARLHPNDSYRVMRALEVILTTGLSIREHQQRHGFENRRFTPLIIGLTMPRQTLYDRIDKRVDLMIGQGLADEVRGLLAAGYDPALKSMQSLGYRHMVDFIHERLTWDEAVRTLKRDHRRYAKRQFTWFNAVHDMRWLAPDQLSEATAMVAGHLEADGIDA